MFSEWLDKSGNYFSLIEIAIFFQRIWKAKCEWKWSIGEKNKNINSICDSQMLGTHSKSRRRRLRTWVEFSMQESGNIMQNFRTFCCAVQSVDFRVFRVFFFSCSSISTIQKALKLSWAKWFRGERCYYSGRLGNRFRGQTSAMGLYWLLAIRGVFIDFSDEYLLAYLIGLTFRGLVTTGRADGVLNRYC